MTKLISKTNCKIKSKFPTRDLAESKADFQSIIYKQKLFVYKCPHCPNYHLTKKYQKE